VTWNFVPVSLALDEAEGQWFSDIFQVNEVPSVTIIEAASERKLRTVGSAVLLESLRDFLSEHPQHRTITGNEMNAQVVETSDTGDEDCISLALEWPNRKRSAVEINKTATIGNLYGKIASLSDKPAAPFKLILPLIELTDHSQLIADCGCQDSVIRIVDL
jgi:hypothetical protein